MLWEREGLVVRARKARAAETLSLILVDKNAFVWLLYPMASLQQQKEIRVFFSRLYAGVAAIRLLLLWRVVFELQNEQALFFCTRANRGKGSHLLLWR